MFSFYMKKTFVDTQPGIELVNLHYTWTPLGADAELGETSGDPCDAARRHPGPRHGRHHGG